MGDIIETKIYVDVSKIVNRVESLVDEKLMLEVHKLFEKMCVPYVPMDEGLLFQNVNITSEYVQYTQPYAHYMYNGELYLTKDGRAFAHLGEKKYPTGIPLNYNLEKHKLASKEWDKAMMTVEGEKFIKQVKDLMVRRAKELYG